MKILSIDTSLPKAAWHTELNTKMYNKRDRIYMDIPYYEFNKSAAVNAFYNNNSFNIYTSRAKEIEILISPVMINLEDTVKITVNDRLVFNEKYLLTKLM